MFSKLTSSSAVEGWSFEDRLLLFAKQTSRSLCQAYNHKNSDAMRMPSLWIRTDGTTAEPTCLKLIELCNCGHGTVPFYKEGATRTANLAPLPPTNRAGEFQNFH